MEENVSIESMDLSVIVKKNSVVKLAELVNFAPRIHAVDNTEANSWLNEFCVNRKKILNSFKKFRILNYKRAYILECKC